MYWEITKGKSERSKGGSKVWQGRESELADKTIGLLIGDTHVMLYPTALNSG
jgi:hypothetical protein